MESAKPQSYQQVRTIVECVRDAHLEAREHCERAARIASDQRLGMAIANLEKHQAEMAEFAEANRVDPSEAILNSWVQYIPLDTIEDDLASIGSATPEQVVARVVRFQNDLGSLFETISEQTPALEVEEFMRTFGQREAAEAKKYGFADNELDDL